MISILDKTKSTVTAFGEEKSIRGCHEHSLECRLWLAIAVKEQWVGGSSSNRPIVEP